MVGVASPQVFLKIHGSSDLDLIWSAMEWRSGVALITCID